MLQRSSIFSASDGDPADPRLIRASERLHQATSRIHAAVENQTDWDAFFANRRAFADLVGRLASVVAPAEAAVARHLHLSDDWFLGRRTAADLRLDLRTLLAAGVDVERDYFPADFDWVDGVAGSAGVLYVLEGSARGAVYLSQLAAKRLAIGPQNGGRYLAGYGAAGAAQWSNVRRWLDQVLLSPGDQAAAAAAARRTFRAYQSALEQAA